MCDVQDVLTNVTLHQRKDHLWDLLGKNFPLSSSVNENDILEMVDTSHKIPMDGIDKRVRSFRDKFSHMQISWRDLFLQLHQSPPFTHCVACTSNDTSVHVVYLKAQDLFLCFKVQDQMLNEACVLVRDGGSLDSIPEIASIVEQFIDNLAKWMFMSCCQFSVT